MAVDRVAAKTIQPLLRAVAADGTEYLFVGEADGTWSIRRDGEIVATGSGDEKGIAAGVTEFLTLSNRLPSGTDPRTATPVSERLIPPL
jgi:hypothetical protein